MRFFIAILSTVAFFAGTAFPQALRDHTITIEDYFTQADIFELAISPDGKSIAYTQGEWRESTNDRKSDIWMVGTDGKESPQRLTFGRFGDHGLQWSPDGRTIYFLGSRTDGEKNQPPFDGSSQVWRLKADEPGEAPFAVTRVKDGVSDYQLDPTGKALYYTTSLTVTDDGFQGLKKKYSSIDYGHGKRRVSQLWRLDLRNWRTEKLLDNKRTIREMAISPDGKKLALITTPDETVLTFEGQSRVDIFHLSPRRLETLPDDIYRADAPSPYGWLQSLAWSADSMNLAFCVVFDAYPAEVVLASLARNRLRMKFMPRPAGVHVRGYGSPLAWVDNVPCFLGEEKGFVRVYSARGAMLTRGDWVVSDFRQNQSAKIWAVLQNDTNQLPDIYVRQWKEGESHEVRVTDVNPQTRTWKWPKIQKVKWKGTHGDDVEGILELPPDYREGERLPLIVCIHGGPTTADHYHLRFWIYGRTLLAAQGYAVLCPNYRGSTGYGDEFLTDLVGHENDWEVEDILAGVDALIERGIADPDKLGVSGWSNGGYLTNCIITKTNRFKAASSGASILDTTMEWGINDEPAYPTVFKTGFPWNREEMYHRTSPSYDLGKVTTPTLIHVGANDERCPPGHSRMLYRALKHYVEVPTELLVYPDEPHGLRTYAHRKAKMEWDLAWFNKYLRPEKSGQ